MPQSAMPEFDETIAYAAETTGDAEVFDEVEEMELASQLLEATSDAELDQFISGLVGRATRSLGQFARSQAGRAIGGLLKQTARRALPFIGRTVGGHFGGDTGSRVGAQAAVAAGRLFGLELEGLSAEDQEFEVARRFVRFGGNAARRASRVAQRSRTRPRAAARIAAKRAARRLAPGLLRPIPKVLRPAAPAAAAAAAAAPGGGGNGGGGGAASGGADAAPEPTDTTPSPPESATTTVTANGGRWVRQGPHTIVINCSPSASTTDAAAAPPSEPPPATEPTEGSDAKEVTVHDIDRTLTELDTELDAFETDQFELDGESDMELDTEYASDFEAPFDEVEELDLANELLSVASEEELDLFIGKALGSAFKKIKRVAGKFVRPLGKVLKGVAKQALPFVGGALGSFIPIPGVGTAVGTALGGALSKALEAEMEGVAPEDREVEMAKRFVRVAGAAAQQVAAAPSNANPVETAKQAVAAAAQQQVPSFASARGAGSLRGRRGRWVRRGSKIVVMGV